MLSALISGVPPDQFSQMQFLFCFYVCKCGCAHGQVYMKASNLKLSLLTEAGSLAELGAH